MGEWTPERQKNLKENIAIGGNYSLGKFRNGHKNINRHGINVIDVHVALTGGDNLYSRQLVEALNEIPDALSEIERQAQEIAALRELVWEFERVSGDLARFGWHAVSCVKRSPHSASSDVCDCGWMGAVREHRALIQRAQEEIK